MMRTSKITKKKIEFSVSLNGSAVEIPSSVFMRKRIIAIGVDPSLTACAMIAIMINRRPTATEYSVILKRIVETDSADPLPIRLELIRVATHNFAAQLQTVYPDRRIIAAVESPPQGAKMFSSATVAKATAACEMGLTPIIAASYTAQAVKRYMVPKWPGLSKANWAEAKYTKKYKRSIPSKASVSSRLAEKCKIYLNDLDLSDAAAIAVYHAHKEGLI